MQPASVPTTFLARPVSPVRVPIALLLPFAFCVACFWLFPVIDGFLLSLQSNTLYGPSHYVGLEHYRALLTDERFLRALSNTTIYAVLTVIVVVPLALALALLMRQSLRARRSGRPFLSAVAQRDAAPCAGAAVRTGVQRTLRPAERFHRLTWCTAGRLDSGSARHQDQSCHAGDVALDGFHRAFPALEFGGHSARSTTTSLAPRVPILSLRSGSLHCRFFGEPSSFPRSC